MSILLGLGEFAKFKFALGFTYWFVGVWGESFACLFFLGKYVIKVDHYMEINFNKQNKTKI
jgi:hypothetical protein